MVQYGQDLDLSTIQVRYCGTTRRYLWPTMNSKVTQQSRPGVSSQTIGALPAPKITSGLPRPEPRPSGVRLSRITGSKELTPTQKLHVEGHGTEDCRSSGLDAPSFIIQ